MPVSSIRYLHLLKPKVGECFIGFGHAVRVVALLDCRAFVVAGGHKLTGEALGHRLLTASAAISNEPANGKSGFTLRAHFRRHLVGRSTDPARANLYEGRCIVHRLAKDFEARLTAALLDEVERLIHNALRCRFLALEHQGIDKLRN